MAGSYRNLVNRKRPFKARKSIEQRLWANIMPEPNSGCWLWIGPDDGSKGYGRLPTLRGSQAHRVSYECFKGEIPEGLTLDHKCRVPSCVNPDHLEPVTMTENRNRGNYRDGLKLGGPASGLVQKSKTHCPQGHEYSPGNIVPSKKGWRRCRRCHNATAHLAANAARKNRSQIIMEANRGP